MGKQRRQRPHGGSRVPQVEMQGLGAWRLEAPAGAVYPKAPLPVLRFHSQSGEGIAHALDVIAI